MTTINGHTLTTAQISALNLLQDYMRIWAGDSHASNSTSPRGDGRWIDQREVFPKKTGHRRAANELAKKGVLRCCEIAFVGGHYKLCPFEDVEATECKAFGTIRSAGSPL